MNKPVQYAMKALFAISLIFVAMGLLTMLRPYTSPPLKASATLNRYSYPEPRQWKGTDSRGGGQNPFAEKLVLDDSNSPLPVDSSLIVLGTLTGRNPQAIVAEASNPTATRIVKLGSVIAGERIIAIGRGYVMIQKEGQTLRINAKG